MVMSSMLVSAAATTSASIIYNAYNPTCSYDACLQQVVGQVDGNPIAQFAACTARFGSPTLSTVTPSADIVYSTVTATSSYTDIVVTFITTTSTAQETVTSYTSVFETTTVYTTTFQSTVTETTDLPSMSVAPAKRDSPGSIQKRKKRGCRPRSSSSLPIASASSTVSQAPFPEATHCANLESYASACACINAAASASTVTGTASTVTSTIYTTASTRVESVVESVVTVVESTVIVQPATTTTTATLDTGTTSIATVTTTLTPIPPTQTSYLVILDGPQAGKQAIVPPGNSPGNFVGWANTGLGTKIAVSVDPKIPSIGDLTLWLVGASWDLSPMYFMTAARAATMAAPPVQVTCSFSTDDGTLSCSTTRGNTKFMTCFDRLCMALPSYTSSSCTETRLKLSSWPSAE